MRELFEDLVQTVLSVFMESVDRQRFDYEVESVLEDEAIFLLTTCLNQHRWARATAFSYLTTLYQTYPHILYSGPPPSPLFFLLYLSLVLLLALLLALLLVLLLAQLDGLACGWCQMCRWPSML